MITHAHSKTYNHSDKHPNTNFSITAPGILTMEMKHHCFNHMIDRLCEVSKKQALTSQSPIIGGQRRGFALIFWRFVGHTIVGMHGQAQNGEQLTKPGRAGLFRIQPVLFVRPIPGRWVQDVDSRVVRIKVSRNKSITDSTFGQLGKKLLVGWRLRTSEEEGWPLGSGVIDLFRLLNLLPLRFILLLVLREVVFDFRNLE